MLASIGSAAARHRSAKRIPNRPLHPISTTQRDPPAFGAQRSNPDRLCPTNSPSMGYFTGRRVHLWSGSVEWKTSTITGPNSWEGTTLPRPLSTDQIWGRKRPVVDHDRLNASHRRHGDGA